MLAEMPGEMGRSYDHSHLDVFELSCLGEIGGRDEGGLAVDDNAFRMKAGPV